VKKGTAVSEVPGGTENRACGKNRAFVTRDTLRDIGAKTWSYESVTGTRVKANEECVVDKSAGD